MKKSAKLKPPSGKTLSSAERERLYNLLEELGEAVQAVGKILRFGYESCHPMPSVHGYDTNRHRLEKELGDIYGVLRLMHRNDDVDLPQIRTGYSSVKLINLRRYLRYPHKFPTKAGDL